MKNVARFTGTEVVKRRSSRRRDILELTVAYGLMLLVIWTPRPWQEMLWFVTAASILAITCMSFEGLEPMGLRTEHFFDSMWAAGAAMVAAALGVALASRLHTLHMPGSPLLFIKHYGLYAVWACVQQLLLQYFSLSRLLRLFSDPTWAAAVAAAMFAVLHLPSPILTVVTLLCGLLACLLFLRYRNLYTVALGHAVLGTTIAICIPGSVIHNMRVGRSYLAYVPQPAPIAERVDSSQPSISRQLATQPQLSWSTRRAGLSRP